MCSKTVQYVRQIYRRRLIVTKDHEVLSLDELKSHPLSLKEESRVLHMRSKSLDITAKTTPFRVAQCVFAPDIENVTTLKRLRKQPRGYEQKNITSYLLPWES